MPLDIALPEHDECCMKKTSAVPKVFFIPWGERERLPELVAASGAAGALQPGDLAAIKIHFGERGNDGFIRPRFTRPIVDMIRRADAMPFFTDTGTIYHGARKNAASHLEVAAEHGFLQAELGAPVIIADGLRGNDCEEVDVGGKHFRRVKIASAIRAINAACFLSTSAATSAL